MGTTLTGTTPATTYDSLIKVGDNGPIDGTLQRLSDGLGNDSALSLSTAAASIAGTLAVTSSASAATTLASRTSTSTNGTSAVPFFDESILMGPSTNMSKIQFGNSFNSNDGTFLKFVVNNSAGSNNSLDVMTLTSAGNVGIGTTAPQSRLHVNGGSTYVAQFNTTQTISTTSRVSIGGLNDGAAGSGGSIAVGSVHNHSGSAQSAMTFYTHDGSTLNEVGRFLATGGLTFNGDTAAANALDDYEEGTWTMGVSFGGAAVGVTYTYNTGTYTKIGRQVTVNGYLALSSKGSSTGSVLVTGLPFTIANSNSNYSSVSFRLNSISFANQYQGYGSINTTTITLEELTEAGVQSTLTDADFANNSEAIVSLTYFV